MGHLHEGGVTEVDEREVTQTTAGRDAVEVPPRPGLEVVGLDRQLHPASLRTGLARARERGRETARHRAGERALLPRQREGARDDVWGDARRGRRARRPPAGEGVAEQSLHDMT